MPSAAEIRHSETSYKPHAAPEFPFSVLAKTMRGVMSDLGEVILEKSQNKGCPELRLAIKHYLSRNRGVSVDVEQIVIGSGQRDLSEHLFQNHIPLPSCGVHGSAPKAGQGF